MKTNFKDKLIENKWFTYQTKLSLSLLNEYDVDNDNLLIEIDKMHRSKKSKEDIYDEYMIFHNKFHRKYKRNNKHFNCPQYHCMRSSYQYHKLSDTTRVCNNRQKLIKLKYDHFKNRKLTKNSLIKEHLWYNLKNKDSIIISGNYSKIIENDIIKYHPNNPNSLNLNNVPVSYIEISLQNKNIVDMNCHLLYFCFDISSYCDIIDCILIMNKKKNKTNYFSYLPLEIIQYILFLNSSIV